MTKTLEIYFKNGNFIATNNCRLVFTSPKQLAGNGWLCTFTSEGDIKCLAIYTTPIGETTMQYLLTKKGNSSLTLRHPDHSREVIYSKSFINDLNSIKEGVILLTDGPIHKKYGFYRKLEFQEFLNKYYLDSVKRINPNRTYKILNEISENKEVYTYIHTDGIILYPDSDSNQKKESYFYGSTLNKTKDVQTISIRYATWVVETRISITPNETICSRVLKTLITNFNDLQKFETIINENNIPNFYKLFKPKKLTKIEPERQIKITKPSKKNKVLKLIKKIIK